MAHAGMRNLQTVAGVSPNVIAVRADFQRNNMAGQAASDGFFKA